MSHSLNSLKGDDIEDYWSSLRGTKRYTRSIDYGLYTGSIGIKENKMERTIMGLFRGYIGYGRFYRGYIGIMENRMETTIVYFGLHIGIMEKKTATTTVCFGLHIGIMEKKMETSV